MKLTYKEKLEWEGIEEAITQQEELVQALQEKLEQTGADFGKAAEISAEITKKEARLAELMERWEYLAQFVD
ncbi:putative ABC transporter, membrane domain and ATP-binding protein [Listeria aquatica FSL S10-1188]|uniref:Putative ABC transporter, membrane domain and ATP-binding protein n=1 Tax=Listeria aquatica FSL S10-1188 TaxID=1265818 RepID=W7BII4_9LIST|nr:putative ABC transporter, membrane domain and ATP-binding protein [Listeria aquatica FSL S10-1188]